MYNPKKSETFISMRTSIPGIAECYPFFSIVLIFYWERVNFVHVSEIINYGKIKKNMVIYQKEKKRATIGLFHGNLFNKIYFFLSFGILPYFS